MCVCVCVYVYAKKKCKESDNILSSVYWISFVVCTIF